MSPVKWIAFSSLAAAAVVAAVAWTVEADTVEPRAPDTSVSDARAPATDAREASAAPSLERDDSTERSLATVQRDRSRDRPDRARVRGRVLDPDGEPVPDAETWLEAGGRAYESKVMRRLRRVDARGTFEHTAIPPGPWAVHAQAPGFEVALAELGELTTGEQRVDVELRLVPTPFVRGVVVWPDGSPVTEATVAFDAIPASDGSLVPGEPVSASLARLRQRHSSSDFIGASPSGGQATTDSEGRFALPVPRGFTVLVGAWTGHLLPSPAERELSVESHARLRDTPVLWRAEQRATSPSAEELRLVLAPRACLVGRVTDARGAPVAREELTVAAEPLRPMGRRPPDVATAADGTFLVDDLAPGEVTVSVEKSIDFLAQEVRIEITGLVQEARIVLQRLPVLSGIVRAPSGAPLAGARVVAYSYGPPPEATRQRPTSRNSISDAKGRFRIEQVQPGWTRLQASSTELVASVPLDVLAVAGEDEDALELWPRLPGTIAGRVLDRQLAPVAAREVSFHPVDDPKAVEVVARGAEGRFTIPRLVPGRYVVRATLEPAPGAGGSTSTSGEPMVLVAEVDVVAGRTSQVILEPER